MVLVVRGQNERTAGFCQLGFGSAVRHRALSRGFKAARRMTVTYPIPRSRSRGLRQRRKNVGGTYFLRVQSRVGIFGHRVVVRASRDEGGGGGGLVTTNQQSPGRISSQVGWG